MLALVVRTDDQTPYAYMVGNVYRVIANTAQDMEYYAKFEGISLMFIQSYVKVRGHVSLLSVNGATVRVNNKYLIHMDLEDAEFERLNKVGGQE